MLCAFYSTDRLEWLKQIAKYRQMAIPGEECILRFDNLKADGISPEHVASLACFVEELDKLDIIVSIDDDSEVGGLMCKAYNFPAYWREGQNYSASSDDKIQNLWRIKDEEKEVNGERVANFLKNRYFKKKDLTSVRESLTEAYYNVFDHADAKGNAFSMLIFNELQGVLNVAVCDFGIGIARSVKDFLGTDISDSEAIKKAMESNFTVGSKSYNSGQGLSNIRRCCTDGDKLWIVANRGLFIIDNNNEELRELDFDFKGTLLFYSLSLDHFDDEEILEDFNW